MYNYNSQKVAINWPFFPSPWPKVIKPFASCIIQLMGLAFVLVIKFKMPILPEQMTLLAF